MIGGRYRVDRVLGAGSMGVVAAAFHLDFEQTVAIKFVNPAALRQVEVALADARSSEVSGPSAVAGSISYDGAGRAILFLDAAGQLFRVPEGALTPKPVAASVAGYWPVPNSPKVLAISDGKLQLFAFDTP